MVRRPAPDVKHVVYQIARERAEANILWVRLLRIADSMSIAETVPMVRLIAAARLPMAWVGPTDWSAGSQAAKV